MGKRAISGVVGIGLFLGLCFGGPTPFFIGVFALLTLASLEWVAAYSRIERLEKTPSERLKRPTWVNFINPLLTGYGCLLPMLAWMSYFTVKTWYPFDDTLAPLFIRKWLGIGGGTLVLIFALVVIHAARTGRALGRLRPFYGLVGAGYIGLLLSSFVLLRGIGGKIVVPPFGTGDRGAWLMLFVAMCVWATDTFAYFIGKAWGRHKLAPGLSPKKTIEGSLGGLLGALLIGALFGAWIHLPLRHGLAIGALAGTFGQIGDLFESALKREIGIKDFGQIMPGHGGALDRFDSLLFVAPLAYLYLLHC